MIREVFHNRMNRLWTSQPVVELVEWQTAVSEVQCQSTSAVSEVQIPGLKSPGSILTSRTETSSLSRVVRAGWDPCSTGKWVKKKISCGWVFDLAVEQPQLFRKLPKNKNIYSHTIIPIPKLHFKPQIIEWQSRILWGLFANTFSNTECVGVYFSWFVMHENAPTNVLLK